jgi:iron-sulfur cluster insertion protein
MITLTTAAAEKIRTMAVEHEMVDAGLRVMVVGGGCAGLSYDMDFESGAKDGDEVYDCDGVKVFVDPMSIAYLEGTNIDYVEKFSFSGFHFENPNAQKSCGCGSSFTL